MVISQNSERERVEKKELNKDFQKIIEDYQKQLRYKSEIIQELEIEISQMEKKQQHQLQELQSLTKKLSKTKKKEKQIQIETQNQDSDIRTLLNNELLLKQEISQLKNENTEQLSLIEDYHQQIKIQRSEAEQSDLFIKQMMLDNQNLSKNEQIQRELNEKMEKKVEYVQVEQFKSLQLLEDQLKIFSEKIIQLQNENEQLTANQRQQNSLLDNMMSQQEELIRQNNAIKHQNDYLVMINKNVIDLIQFEDKLQNYSTYISLKKNK